jgi:hypothetical protein
MGICRVGEKLGGYSEVHFGFGKEVENVKFALFALSFNEIGEKFHGSHFSMMNNCI